MQGAVGLGSEHTQEAVDRLGAQPSVFNHASGVNHHVDAPQLARCLLDDRLDGIGLCQVCRQVVELAASFAHALRRAGQGSLTRVCVELHRGAWGLLCATVVTGFGA